jgi:amino acid transporter
MYEHIADYLSNIMQVDKDYPIPIRTIGLVAVIVFLLGLLNIASTTAFNALVSLAVIGQYASYLFAISLLLIRKYSKKDLPLGPFQLVPTFGVLVNGFSIAFAIMVIVFSAFPPYQPVSADNMNYSSVILVAVPLLSVAWWFIFGRRAYGGPVREVADNRNVRRAVE